MNLISPLSRDCLLSRPALRRTRRVVLPLGRAQGRRPHAGARWPALHAALLRLHQAARQKHAAPPRNRRLPDARLAADRGFIRRRRRGPAAGSSLVGRLPRRPDPAARAAGTAVHLHHRRRFLVALHLRRDRLGARSRTERFLQHRLSAGYRLYRGVAAYIAARSSGLPSLFPRCIGLACSRFSSAFLPSCTSILSPCQTRNRKSTPDP